MNPQLKHLQIDLERASKRAHALVAEVPEEQWDLRPGPDRWSVAECIEHLIITSTESLPPIRKALTDMKGQRSGSSRRYRRDFLGWLIWKSQAETTAMRSRTAAGFVPTRGARKRRSYGTVCRESCSSSSVWRTGCRWDRPKFPRLSMGA
jgi:hypothetical protein